MLLNSPSGDLFGLTQNAGMGWNPAEAGRKQFLILSTQGGLRAPDGKPVALGYHTGHWEIGLLVQAAAEEFRKLKTIPFAGCCSDPCDGRTQGTTGMFDSLPYRNDAAIIFRRLARSLPQRARRARHRDVRQRSAGDDDGRRRIARFAGGDCARRRHAAGRRPARTRARCKHWARVLRTGWSRCPKRRNWAAARALRPAAAANFSARRPRRRWSARRSDLSVPHSALAPSGQPVWLDLARRSARALFQLDEQKIATRDILTDASIENAMVVHAAFGGSTNLLLHIPAIAHAAGLKRPTVEDWISVNRRVPRLVSVLPNGPVHHPTVRVFLAGGVPEVMLHLRKLNLLHTDVLTVTGKTLGENLDCLGKIRTPRAVPGNFAASWTAWMRMR